MSSLSTAITGLSRRVTVALVAVAVALGLAVAAGTTQQAQAAHRDWLRPDATGHCHWDPVGYWVQRCDVWSAAMGRNIPVQIQPAQRGGNAALYLLDGLRATEHTSAWLHDVNAAKTYVDHNITVVMPVGGTASFYTDWDSAFQMGGQTVNYKWETFLTTELKDYLAQHFGVAPHNNSIAGLSMGGTAAIVLAAKHPGQFRQALSFSGYLNTSFPGAHTFLGLALSDAGGFNINNMYGSFFSPRRFENDPYNLAGRLQGRDVYISAASGLPRQEDWQKYQPQHVFSGMFLEWVAKFTTTMWESKARTSGVQVTSHYPAQGVHNWVEFGYELEHSKPRVLTVMNAW